jgi:prepilin-type N-terminal cleavage/methylation domain-containing protein
MKDLVRPPEFGPAIALPGAPRPYHAVTLRGGGFTLIELMLVIGVISLLMVFVVPAVSNLKGSSDLTNAAYTRWETTPMFGLDSTKRTSPSRRHLRQLPVSDES